MGAQEIFVDLMWCAHLAMTRVQVVDGVPLGYAAVTVRRAEGGDGTTSTSICVLPAVDVVAPVVSVHVTAPPIGRIRQPLVVTCVDPLFEEISFRLSTLSDADLPSARSCLSTFSQHCRF